MLKVVLIEEDIAMQALIAEWLTQAGYGVEAPRGGAATPQAGVALVIASALLVGLVALGVLLWALSSGQYDDLQGDAERILMDEEP